MIITTPLGDEVKKLRIGDVVELTGTIYTARDRAHLRILEYVERGRKLPFDLRGYAIYHCGPLTRGNEIISCGPTTSKRMEFAHRVISLGVKAVIGKGGVGRKMIEEMVANGCVYLAFTGGCGALAARQIRRVLKVYWRDLGDAEAVWKLEVDRFGPMIVAVDCRGESIYE